MMVAVGMALAIGWCLGRQDSARVQAAPPVPAPQAEPSDYSKRVVAYIFGDIPITREDLGEYLIARYGAEKLDLLINKKIIEHVCKQKGIRVTGADIEADYDYMIRNVGIPKKEFVANVLKQYRKTEYEWKEDVIRPRLMLTQFCKERVQVTDEDLQKAFEAKYGEKVDVQIILYPANQQKYLAQLYDKVRQGDEAFDEEAKKQPDPNLAMTAGRIKPVGRYSGLEDIEKTAFSLKPGQVSHVLQVPEGWLIIKCRGRLPASSAVKLEDKREELTREVLDKKIAAEIPKVFAELAKDAKPKNFLAPERASRTTQEKEVEQLIQQPLPSNR
jgi:hypothetical protein